MAKLWAWGAGCAALVGLTAVGAGVSGAKSHLVEMSTLAKPAPVDPACAPGPDYSAAVCLAATTPDEGPITTAGGDQVIDNAPPADKVAAAQGATGLASPTPAGAPVRMAAATPPPIIMLGAPAQAQTQPAAQAPIVQASAARTIDRTPVTLSRPAMANEAPVILATARTAFADAQAASGGFMNHVRSRVAFEMPRLTAGVDRFRRSVQLRVPLDGLLKLVGGVAQNVNDRARVYVFAGRGNRVMGFNMTRDSNGFAGVGGAGWSMEPADKVSDAQVGVAWKRGNIGLAVIDMQRKFAQFGTQVKDNMVGFRFTFTPGSKTHRAPTG
jgi:hypothetical protein